MMTGVVLSIGREEVLENCSEIEVEHPHRNAAKKLVDALVPEARRLFDDGET